MNANIEVLKRCREKPWKLIFAISSRGNVYIPFHSFTYIANYLLSFTKIKIIKSLSTIKGSDLLSFSYRYIKINSRFLHSNRWGNNGMAPRALRVVLRYQHVKQATWAASRKRWGWILLVIHSDWRRRIWRRGRWIRHWYGPFLDCFFLCSFKCRFYFIKSAYALVSWQWGNEF